MNKLTLIAALVGCAILTGCVSEEITWGGEKAVRNPDGTVLVNKDTGAPYYEKEQNHLERFTHLNDTELKDFHVKADRESYEAAIGTLGSFTGSNTIGVINASIGGATKLVAECGVLYAKIAGGATAAVASEVAEKAITLFTSKGGDVDKATAAIAGDKIQVTDGTTFVTCDQDGNCSIGTCATGNGSDPHTAD